MIRVGFILPVLNDGGGTEIWHWTLLNALKELDGEIEIVGLAINDVWRSEYMANRLRRFCPVWLGEQACRELACRVDKLVVWGIASLESILPITRRPEVICVCHGDKNSAWTVSCMKAASPFVDMYVAVAPAAMEAIPLSRQSDSIVIENGINIARLRPTRSRRETRESLGIASFQKILLSMNRLSEEKDPLGIVRALESLDGDWIGLVGGAGMLASSFPTDNKSIIMLGNVQDNNIGNIYNIADCFISTSRTEGFGLSIIEAAFAGLPVVTTKVGIVCEEPYNYSIIPIDATRYDLTLAVSGAIAMPVNKYYSSERFGRDWLELLLSR